MAAFDPYRGRRTVRVGTRRGWPIGMRRMKPTHAAPPVQSEITSVSAEFPLPSSFGDEDNATAFARGGKVSRYLKECTDAALTEKVAHGDEDSLRYRGGVVLRKKEKDYAGISRTRANVDTSDGFLRGGDTLQQYFDAVGRPTQRVTANKPRPGEKR